MKKIKLSEEEWKKKLTQEQFKVLRKKGTELPFTGKLLYNKDTGMYTCGACGNPLFSSDAKFDSGTGWPSFFKPATKNTDMAINPINELNENNIPENFATNNSPPI